MRTVNFDDLDDGTQLPAGDPARPGTVLPVGPESAIPLPRGERDWTADYLDSQGGCYESTCGTCGQQFFGWKGRVECRLCAAGGHAEMGALLRPPVDLTGTGLDELAALAPPVEAEVPAASRSIHAVDEAIRSPSKSLGEAVQVVLENYGRLTPSQVEALHGVLLELGADLDSDAEAGGKYGPDFDMTAFIQRMLRTTRSIENRLYLPGEEGMKAAFTAQELGAITNANKNLMALIAKNHDKVMGWERQRAIEAAHMAAARDLPADIQDRYLAKLQAELEQRGL